MVKNLDKDSRSARYALLKRLAGYILKYRMRVALGVLLSFLVSIANLFTLTAFVPIFNTLGETEQIVLFRLTAVENDVRDRYLQGAELARSDQLLAQWVRVKTWVNQQVEGKSSQEVIFLLCWVIVPMYFFKILCMLGALYAIGTAALMAVRNLRYELYCKMNRLGIEYFTQEKTGYIMSRIINDVELMGKSLSTEFNEALTNIFYIFTHFALLAFISWKMLLVSLVVLPLTMWPITRFASRIRGVAAGAQEALAEMGGHVKEIISGIRVIRAFSMERFELKRFSEINDQLRNYTFLQHYFYQVGPALTEFVCTVVATAFMAWGAYEISDGTLSRGLFFTFFFTLIFLMRPLKQVSVLINLLNAATVAAQRIFDELDKEPSVMNDAAAASFKGFQESIVYKNVDFKYNGNDKYAIREVSFSVRRGRTVAIVGSSGAGKSTMLDLLPRFYDVVGGSIEIDGVDIRRLKKEELRRAIGIVQQNIFLFNATVQENISYGRPDIALEKIVAAAKTANAHEFISNLPEAYQTSIGESGVMLSGGQRQRIAIARALLRDPPILIFDEATSSLDTESEMLVQEAMERLFAGDRTVFIIAHRLSTVYKSDEILLLDHGRIVERGTHQELLRNGKNYQKLYEMQFAGS